jgi:hypothetical protein
MAKFKDRSNREWEIEFDGPLLEKVEQATGIDISLEDGTGLIEVCAKGPMIVRVCWILCQRQMGTVTAEDFGRAMASGEAIEGAEKALKQALTDFTRPSRRGALTAVLTSQDRVTAETVAALVEKVSDKAMQDQIVDAMKARMADTLEKVVTRMRVFPSSVNATPATSESAPTA